MPSQRQREIFPTPLNFYLNDTFKKRQIKNSRYSLRAFARDLDIPASKLSEILSGNSVPGPVTTQKMIEGLKLKVKEKHLLEEMVAEHRSLQKKTRGAKTLQEDEYALIADLEHYAIFCMMNLDKFNHSPSWTAKRLGLGLDQVLRALSRLHRLGLIQVSEDKFTPVLTKVTTTHDIPSEVIRASHRKVLEHALLSLERDTVENRDITSITLAVDKERLPEAKSLIKEFRRKMATLMESGPKNEIYNLNIQFVPLTVPSETRK